MAVKKSKGKAQKTKPTKVVAKKTKAKPTVKKAAVKKPAKKAKAVAKKVSAKKVITKQAKPKLTQKAKPVKAKAPSTKAPIAKTPKAKAKAQKPATSSATIIGAINFEPYKLQKDEEYMNEAQREHFRKILMLWKQQLMQEVDSTVIHMKEEAIVYPDPLDRASQEEGFNLELRTRDRERKLIKKIEQALDALEKGEYGYCEDCGAEIGIRRLEARPTADKCIDCKTFEEIREKQVGIV